MAGIRDRVISAVKQHLGNDAIESGSVLYNGWSTLCPSNEGLYIMGFNPGGDPDKISTSIVESLGDLDDNYCSYEDECWKKDCPTDCRNEEHFGKTLHQTRVKHLAEILGYDIRKVFAANAIFIRSKNQDDLQKGFFDRCWPIHELFLSTVNPKIILCLGNGETLSAFSLLKDRLKPNQIHSHGRIKVFSSAIAVFDGGAINSLVIGVRHPSWWFFDPVQDLSLYVKENPHAIAGQRWNEV